MSYRGRSYGLSAELDAKMNAKYDVEREKSAREWIESVTGASLDPSTLGAEHFQTALKDGIILCRLWNAISPGNPIKKINESKMAFKQMENISSFLDKCKEYGVPSPSLFQTVDLYERRNMAQVLGCIWALGGQAQKQGYGGPSLGVKVANKETREWTEEELKKGESMLPQQAGYTQGASQAGMTAYGTTRHL